MDHRGRQQRLQNSLSTYRLDTLLVTHPPNLRYLCGFTGSSGALLLTETKRVFITDGRYTEQARVEVRSAQIVIARGHVQLDYLTQHVEADDARYELRTGRGTFHHVRATFAMQRRPTPTANPTQP